MKIMIVEDEEALAKGLKFNFEQEGYEVVTVGDGATALELFTEMGESCDLIILDIMLPGMSGYETCRNIREIDNVIPILVLSARSLSEDTFAFPVGSIASLYLGLAGRLAPSIDFPYGLDRPIRSWNRRAKIEAAGRGGRLGA